MLKKEPVQPQEDQTADLGMNIWMNAQKQARESVDDNEKPQTFTFEMEEEEVVLQTPDGRESVQMSSKELEEFR